MTPETLKWVEKAESDFDVAGVLYRRRKSHNFDAVCFHCQQCIEKYLKARLVEAGMAFPKTHDCVTLLKLVVPLEPLWTGFAVSCANLSPFAIEFRYPGNAAVPDDAAQAIADCKAVREAVRLSLDLPAAKQPKLARNRKSR